jgi:hypothetical protein
VGGVSGRRPGTQTGEIPVSGGGGEENRDTPLSPAKAQHVKKQEESGPLQVEWRARWQKG